MQLIGIFKENCCFFLSLVIYAILTIFPTFDFNQIGTTQVVHTFEVEVEGYAEYKGITQRFIARSVNDEGAYRFRVITTLDDQFEVGDILLLKSRIEGRINISERIKGINAVLIFPEILDHDEGLGFFSKISRFRNNLLEKINEIWHGSNASLLAGLLIGAKFSYSDTIIESFRNTLTMHLIVVSGFNIGFIHRLVMRLASVIGRKKTYLVSIFMLTFYYFIVGIDNIPCLRAFIMILLQIFALVVGRRVTGLQVWGISLILILIFIPSAVHDVSLQLSYIASLGVLIVAEISRIVKLSWMIEAFLVTIVCNILTYPIMVQFNNLPSFNSLIVNILVTPLVPFIMCFALTAIIIDSLQPGAFLSIVHLVNTLIDLLFFIILGNGLK